MLGTGRALEVLRESDPDVLLALSAVNHRVAELHDMQQKRLAQHIIHELSNAWK